MHIDIFNRREAPTQVLTYGLILNPTVCLSVSSDQSK